MPEEPITEAQASENRKEKRLPDAAKPHMFKPGQSGNPGGRPKRDLRAVLSLAAFEILCEQASLPKNAKAIAKMIVKNPKMFQVTADGAFGKVPQTLNIQGELTISSKVEERLRAARKRNE